MESPLQPAFDMYMEKLQKQVAEVASTKKMLNELAKEMGSEIPFPDVQAEAVTGQSLRLDQFFGKAASTALTEYLELRGQDRGAATWSEIWAAFNRGGFNSEESEDGVKTTLKKNTATFKYFSMNDAFGLKKWYPQEKKKDKPEGSNGDATNVEKPRRGRPPKIKAAPMVDQVSKQAETETPKG